MRSKPTLTLAIIALATFSLVAAAPAADRRHPSGITLLDPLDRTLPPYPDSINVALSEGQDLAFRYPDALGRPWFDRATGEVVLPVATSAGATIAAGWRPTAPIAQSVRIRTQANRRSFSELRRVMDDAIGARIADLPDSDAIYLTTIDEEHDRVIAVVDRLSDALLFALAKRFGTQILAVRLDALPGRMSNASRQADYSPFWGGARVNFKESGQGCSSGFSFRDNATGEYIMASAGHCADTGAQTGAYTPYVPPGGSCLFPPYYCYYQGNVAPNSWENWSNTSGTVCVTGQWPNDCFGDLAMARIPNPKYAEARIYRGDSTSSSSTSVKEGWTTRSQTGQYFCTGGATTGELCGWRVDYGFTNNSRGPGVTAYGVAVGSKSGPCLAGGDSGGPVYTVRTSDGLIAAKGILGGASGGCGVDYTDIVQIPITWPSTSLITSP